jgi:hypothetical protein
VEGPFDTNAAAWRALDRRDGSENAPPKQISNKPVLWGKPDQPKKGKKARRKERARQERAQPAPNFKMTPKQEHRMKVNAAKAPGWVRSVAAVKFDPAAERSFRDQKLGTFGPASAVKKIDPAEYLAAKARGEH